MRILFNGRSVLFALTAALFCLSSCSSYYWVLIDNADLEVGEKIYKVRTCSGDTINFRIQPRSSAVFDGEEIRGIDVNGDEHNLELCEVREIELVKWEPELVYLVCCGLLAAIVFIAVELNSEGAQEASSTY